MDKQLGIDVSIRAEMARFEKAMADAGRIVETSGGTMDKATKRAEQGFARLESALDPAAKAIQRLERDTAKVQMALDKEAISVARAAKVQAQLNDQYEATILRLGSVTTAQNNYAQSAARGVSSSRNMGNAVQQAGYQVGDFAVQVASGQGVLRPFIQQGTQLVSMFGPWGAVIGAAGAIVGALATAFLNSSDAADTAQKSYESLAEATQKLTEETSKGNETARQSALNKLDEAEAHKASADAIIKEAEAILIRRKAELEATNIGGAFVGSNPLAEKLGMNIAAATAEIEKYQAISVENGETIDRLRDKLNGLDNDYELQISQNARLADAAKVSRREYEILNKTFELINGTFAGTEEQARAVAIRLLDSEAAVDMLTKGQDKASKATAKATVDAEKQIKTYDAFIAAAELKNASLEREINGQKALNPLLEAEAEVRKILGRELLPDEEEALKRIYGVRQQLNGALEEQRELQKAADAAAKESARVWERAAQNIQDSLADVLFEGKDVFEALKDTAKAVSKQIAAALIFQPIMNSITGGSSSTPGALGSSFGGLSTTNVASLAQSAGSWIGGLFGGGATPTAAAQAAGTVGAHAAPYIGGAATTGSTVASGSAAAAAGGAAAGGAGGLGGAASAAYAIPVWGWIAAAAATIKGFVEGADPKSVKGAISTLLMPSPEEWQANPKRSLANLDPVGLALTDFGLPGWLTPGGTIASLLGNDQPSNFVAGNIVDFSKGTISSPSFDPSEKSQQNIDALQALSEQFLALEKKLVEITGGTVAGFAHFAVGSRDGIVAGYGNTQAAAHANVKRYANSEAGATQALEDMVKSIAANITGVTDEIFKKALQGSTADDILNNVQFVADFLEITGQVSATPLADALQAVNDQFDSMIPKVKELGLSEEKLEEARAKALASREYELTSGVYQNINTAAGTINAFLQSQELSADSSLNPMQRLQSAQGQFNDALSAVRGGDLTQVNTLANSASALLGIGRSNYASSVDFANLEGMVRSSLASVGQTITSEQYIGDQITSALQGAATLNASKLDELKAELVGLRRDLQIVNDKLAA